MSMTKNRKAAKEELSIALTEAIGQVPKEQFERLSRAVEAWRQTHDFELAFDVSWARFFYEAIEEALEGPDQE